MKKITYIDCHAAIDKWATKDQHAPWTVENMLTDMERCQIHGALVYSNLAKEMQPSLGNNYVVQTCREHPRLIPCWITLPHHCEDFPEASKFINKMLENGVKAVKLFPKLHRYSLDERTVSKLLTALQEAEIPMIVDCGENEPELQQINWDEIAPLCTRYPQLNIILHREWAL